MTDVATRVLSPAEVAELTEDELDIYIALLEAEAADWNLTPRQQRAEDLSNEVDVLLYGGAAGGGKTDWLVWHADQMSRKHPGHTTLALRRTFPQLKDSLIRRSVEKIDQADARYLVGEKEWTYENGSTIRFGFCDNEDDYRHYLSAEYDLILFEELTEFSELQFKMIRSRCRTTRRKRARGIRPHVVAATNPGQIGHEWVKTYFVQATNYGRDVAQLEIKALGQTKTITVGFVPAKVSDNPHIDPDYIFNLAGLPDIQKRQYLDGDWDIFEGQYFGEWSADKHVRQPFRIPEHWTRIRGYDYGYAAPFCCLWAAIDPDRNIYIYREAYHKGMTASEQGKLCVDLSMMTTEIGTPQPEKIHRTAADPSIWAKGGTGVSIAQQLRMSGMHVSRAMNARIDGWNRVRDWLRATDTRELANGQPDPHFGPRLYVFSTCTNLVRTLPVMIHDKKHPEDLDTDLEDHAVDALRYLLMDRAPHPLTKEPAPKNDDQREWARVRALDTKKRSTRPVHEVLGRL